VRRRLRKRLSRPRRKRLSKNKRLKRNWMRNRTTKGLKA